MMKITQTLIGVDQRLFLNAQTSRVSKALKPYARAISRTGDGPLYAVIAIAILFTSEQYGALFFTASLLAYAVNIPTYLILKNTIKRQRPQQSIANFKAHIIPSDYFSFPSGHTASAFVMAIIVTLFFPMLSAVFFIWAALIGCSRVLLGVHFPGDILAGIALGSFSAFIGVAHGGELLMAWNSW